MIGPLMHAPSHSRIAVHYRTHVSSRTPIQHMNRIIYIQGAHVMKSTSLVQNKHHAMDCRMFCTLALLTPNWSLGF